MSGMLWLKLTLTVIFLTGASKAIFKKWKKVPLPPGECVLGFDYCKIGCSYCTVCYVNLIDCSLRPKTGPSRQNQTDFCVIQLDMCKANCSSNCTHCYTKFIDCKDRINKNENATDFHPATFGNQNLTTAGLSMPENTTITDIKNQTSSESSSLSFSEEHESLSGSGSGTASVSGRPEDSGIDIGIPGIPVFIVDNIQFPSLSRSEKEFEDGLKLSQIFHENKQRENFDTVSAVKFPLEDLQNENAEKLEPTEDEVSKLMETDFDFNNNGVGQSPISNIEYPLEENEEHFPTNKASETANDDSNPSYSNSGLNHAQDSELHEDFINFVEPYDYINPMLVR